MSDTFTAGMKLRAVDMVPQKIWTVSATSSNTATGAHTIISTMGTSPSTTYRAGRAYRISIRLRLTPSVANFCEIKMYDTNLSGTQRMPAVSFELPNRPLQAFGFHFEHIVANTGGSDITGRVLVLSTVTNTGTVQVVGASTCPAYWECTEIGEATDFTEAVAL